MKMPCESCAVQFSVFKRKRACPECDRYYCSSCLRRGGGLMCAPCRILSTRPLSKQTINHLKVRDLQHFLNRQNVSTRGCVEKEDLLNLTVLHVNSTAYRRRAGQQNRNSNDFSNVFISLKGFTSNINNLINSAFDHNRHTPNGAQFSQNARATANSHHSPTTGSSAGTSANFASATPSQNMPTTDTQYEGYRCERTRIPPSCTNRPPPPEVIISPDGDDSLENNFRETEDCLEVVDVDDPNEWEIIRNPLPNDSNVLLASNEDDEGAPIVSQSLPTRAASELDLRHTTTEATDRTDTASLKDETFSAPLPRKRIDIKDVKDVDDLENLNAKQLKEMLALNRVDFKGCVERGELLQRARRLFRETIASKEDLSKLSMDELCKICMDAPLECVLLECGHIATCTNCGKRLNECPICRQYVIRAVRFFKS